MSVVWHATYTCDFTGCNLSIMDTADLTGWTTRTAPYPVNGMPGPVETRCPTHANS